MRQMRVLQAIFLSLAIHFLLVLLVENTPVLEKKSENISVELIDSKDLKNQRQIVRDHLIPDKIKVDNTEDPLSFLSEKTQRVRKQTQAAVTGMTKNRGAQKPQKAKPQEKSLDTTGLDAFAPKYRTNVEARDAGVSTIGEAMPKEVTVGSFTALNTDRYLYYSFFARIEDLIRFRWESAVQSAIDETPPSAFNNFNNSWVTNLEIWLKSNGEYHSAHLMKESGFRGFDQAAIQAFVQAGTFQNPPKELIERDGLIRLKYTFRVYHKPTLLGRSNN